MKRGAPLKPIDKKYSGGKIMLNMSEADGYLVACAAKTINVTQQKFMRDAVIEYVKGTPFRLVSDPVTRGAVHEHRIVLGITRADKKLAVDAALKTKSSISRFVREITRGKCLLILGVDQYNEALEEYVLLRGYDRSSIEFGADPGEPGQELRLTSTAMSLRKTCEACGETFHLEKKVHSFRLWCDLCREPEIAKIKEKHNGADQTTLNRAADVVDYRMQGHTLSETGLKFSVSKQRIEQIEKWFLG